MRARRVLACACALFALALAATACGASDNGGVIKGTPATVTTTTAATRYG